MQYEIGGGAFPVVTCNLSDGESMITESGAMAWMTPNMEMSTSGGGIGKMFSKAFSGEALFQNIWTARGDGMIAFGSCFPGASCQSRSVRARAGFCRSVRSLPRKVASS